MSPQGGGELSLGSELGLKHPTPTGNPPGPARKQILLAVLKRPCGVRELTKEGVHSPFKPCILRICTFKLGKGGKKLLQGKRGPRGSLTLVYRKGKLYWVGPSGGVTDPMRNRWGYQETQERVRVVIGGWTNQEPKYQGYTSCLKNEKENGDVELPKGKRLRARQTQDFLVKGWRGVDAPLAKKSKKEKKLAARES